MCFGSRTFHQMPVPGVDGPGTAVGKLIFGFDVPANLPQVNNDCEHQKLVDSFNCKSFIYGRQAVNKP